MTERATGRRALRVDRIFDGLANLPGSTFLVIVEDGLITSIDSSGAVAPEGCPVDELGAVTLLPGLIDAHTHLVFDASADAVQHVQEQDSSSLLDQMRQAAGTMLRAGITTVRDLGDRDFLSLRVRAITDGDPFSGPTVVAAGPPLTPTRGHCWFLGGEADGVSGLRRAIAERYERGVDVVKVMTTGGEMTVTTRPEQSQYTLPELRAAADHAHELGLRIAGHAHGRQGIADALAAGFDTLEHVSFRTAAGSIDPDPVVVDAIAAAGTIASLTWGFGPTFVPTPEFERTVVPALAAHVRALYDAGVRITIGPDSGIHHFKPHNVLPHAIATFVQLGLPERAALTAATVTAADACGLAGITGRIAPGHRADLIAVNGDPLTDITTLQRPVAVYRMGRHVH